MITTGMVWDREPRREWVEKLEEITPRSDCLSWLMLCWEPGDPWEPVGRWVIWQMRSKALIANRYDLLAELEGPHPRSTGHYCGAGWCLCDLKANRYVGGPPLQYIDRLTWELYQRTGCYGTRYWVVQGDRGGHRYAFDFAESTLSERMGGPTRPPSAGDLPYAEPDARTWALIAAQDKLRQYNLLTDFLYRSPEIFDAEERAQAETAAAALWTWLEAQMGAVVDEHWGALRASLADAPRLPDAKARIAAQGDLDTAREQFIANVAGTR